MTETDFTISLREALVHVDQLEHEWCWHCTDVFLAAARFVVMSIVEASDDFVERIASDAYRFRIDPVTDEVSVVPWENVSEWLKEDYRRFVRRILAAIIQDTESAKP